MHSRTFFGIFILSVALGAHVFVASWAADAIPMLRRRRTWVLSIALAICSVAALGRVGAALSRADAMVELSGIGMTEWMIVIFGTIPLVFTMLVARLVRVLARPGGVTPASPAGETVTANGTLTRREAVERLAGGLALGASTACLGWGMVRGRHVFELEEVVVRIAGLPRTLDGYTIAQVSDIHAGVFVGDRDLAEGFSLVRATRPDAVVVTGDLVDLDPRYLPRLAASLTALAPRDGLFAVLGNHDYYAGSDAVIGTLRGSGIALLLNEARIVRAADEGGFALLGVDDLWASRWNGVGPDLARAARGIAPDVPRILLAHQPAYFDFAAGEVALQLSGHTHGGQINPGFRPADFLMRYVAGRYERRGSTLWVNRGFGVAGPPSRVGAPPEVTKVILVAA